MHELDWKVKHEYLLKELVRSTMNFEVKHLTRLKNSRGLTLSIYFTSSVHTEWIEMNKENTL